MVRASAHGFSPDVLVELRRSAGMSQAALAGAVSVSVGTLRSWERGRKIPQVAALGRLASVLGERLGGVVTVADLVDMPEGERTLVDWRLVRTLTQAEAASKAGLSPSHYGSLERGTAALSDYTAEAIAAALGISVEEAWKASKRS